MKDNERETLRKKLFDKPESSQLIFIGRLTRQKKLNILIDAVTLLKEEGRLVNLLFVGDGEEKTVLQRQMEKNDISDQICFYGASYDETTNYKLIASSDCCVAPGEIGLTAIHSLMYGVPVISHSNPDKQMPEFEAIVQGFNGDLFEHNNVEDLKSKIKNVLDFKKTRSRMEIKKNCYQIVDQYYNPIYQVQVIDNVFNQKPEKFTKEENK
ncbi:MAG: glycosyltransferase [Bacteroidota bacterium]